MSSSVDASRPLIREGNWACPEPRCSIINPMNRNTCETCGKPKPKSRGRIAREIGKDAAEKSKGLFAAEDWSCTKCGNINWSRRTSCNTCNASKKSEIEARTGYGGGFMDREAVEYKKRNDSDEEYDEFGRKKKSRNANENQRRAENKESDAKKDEDEDEDDEEDDDGDISKYKLDDDDELSSDKINGLNKDAEKRSDAKRKLSPSAKSRSSSGSSRSRSRSSSSSRSASSRSSSRSSASSRGSQKRRSGNSRSHSRSQSNSQSRERSVNKRRSRSRSRSPRNRR